jgi:hypothetical protein
MEDLHFEVPATDEVEADAEELRAIDLGIQSADQRPTVALEEVRKMIPEWISKFESRKRP